MGKLKGLGWGHELETSEAVRSALEEHPSVNQPRPLTDRSEHINGNTTRVILIKAC